MIKYLPLLCLAGLLGAAACTSSGPRNYLVTLSISQADSVLGQVRLVLYDSTPIHRDNFVSLVRAGAYDGTIFHRVISDFMVQGGDIPRTNTDYDADSTLPAEFFPGYFHKKGALAAARLGDAQNPERRSSAYQFYIVQGVPYATEQEITLNYTTLQEGVLKLYNDSTEIAQQLDSARNTSYEDYTEAIYALIPTIQERYGLELYKDIPRERIEAYLEIGGTPHLDDDYTVFGEVVEGLDLVDRIAATPTAGGDRPTEDVILTTATVEEISPSELQARYGTN